MLAAMEAGDRVQISKALERFKVHGVVDFVQTLTVPAKDRIPWLVTLPNGRARVSAAISGAIKGAMDMINLRVGLSADQIVELAEEIIEEANSDFIALEDVLLFLQQLVRGKAGKIYDRMDIPTFFELFETYREERHQAKQLHDYNTHLERRGLGPSDRLSEKEIDEHNQFRAAMQDHLRKKVNEKSV